MSNAYVRRFAKVGVVTVVCWGTFSSALAAESQCATPAQAEDIRAAFAKPNPPLPVAAAAELKLPEALVVSALPADQAHGVEARHFQTVWASLQEWEQAVFVVMKGAHVFESYGKVFAGEPSKRSKYFNLHGEGPGMSGHLRPDLLASIYVVTIPGKENTTRGVLFYDTEGESMFGVFVPGEGAKPSETLVKQFEQTAAELRALPSYCGKPRAAPASSNRATGS